MAETEAQRLLAVANQLSEKVEALSVARRKDHRMARILAVSVVFDIVLSIGLGWNALRVDDALDKARVATSQTRLACETANTTNQKNKELWDFAFGLGEDPDMTPVQKERVIKFREFIDRTFVQKVCD